MKIKTIRSGGQSGVDRAALDFAIENDISYEGWIPKGGWAEDFPKAPGLLSKYLKLKETETSEIKERTYLNVQDSDGTLIIYPTNDQAVSGGTTYTFEVAKELNKPVMIISLDFLDQDAVSKWLESGDIEHLNIAGPRESECPGIYKLTRKALYGLIR